MMNASILIIDDERELLISLSKTLQKEGCTVACSSDPDAAVHYVRKQRHQFDLIITDYWMPGMKGLEVITQIKEAIPNIPIILITAYGTDQTFATANEMGAVACLSKPIDKKKLLTVIQETTSNRMIHHEMENNI